MRAVLVDKDVSAAIYVDLDAVQTFRVLRDTKETALILRFANSVEMKVVEPYASAILALLLPPALPAGPVPKCWAKQDINGHESLCTLPKGHPGPCRYESPGASPALPMRPR